MKFSIPELQEIRKRLSQHYDRYVNSLSPDAVTKEEYIKINLPTVLKNILDRRSWANGVLSLFDPNTK